jgi:transposase-like protein
MSGDYELSNGSGDRVEVFTVPVRRRRWSAELKAQIVAESYASSVGEVAARYTLSKTQVFIWRRAARDMEGSGPAFARVELEHPGYVAGSGMIEPEVGVAR